MKKNTSISCKLILALSAVALAVGLVDAVITFTLTKEATRALLDTRLSEVAQRVAELPPEFELNTLEAQSGRPQDLRIQVWPALGERLSGSPTPLLQFNPTAVPGFSDLTIQGEQWHVFTVQNANRKIEVGQRSEIRVSLSPGSALKSILPAALMVPLMCLAVVFVVRRTMRQVDEVAANVEAIDLNNPAPLPTQQVSADLLPFVSSINLLIDRLARMREAEQKFISDAAHELRSPITALQIQAENLRHAIDPQHLERFEELRRGIQRGVNLIRQMLCLARVDARADQHQLAIVCLRSVITKAISDLLPLAAERRIDLGVESIDDVTLHAVETDIGAVVKNLLENGVRYSANGGTVDVRVQRRSRYVRIDVIDSGPGLDPSQRERLFERFVRGDSTETEGTGLGLAIVRATVNRYGGRASLLDRSDGRPGLVARAEFPLPVQIGAITGIRKHASAAH